MFFFIIPFMAYFLTGDISKSGLILAIEWVVRLSVLPWIGIIVDRLGSRIAVLISDGFRLITFVLIALLWFFRSEEKYLIICFLAVAMAFILEVSYVSNEAFIVNQFKKNTYRFQNLSQSFDQLAAIIAPGMAAFFSKYIPFEFFLGLMATISVVNFTIVLLGSKNQSCFSKESIRSSCYEGFRLVIRNSELLLLTIWAFCINFLYGCIISTLNYFVIGIFNQTNITSALLVTMAGIASVVALRITSEHKQAINEFQFWGLLAALSFTMIYALQNLFIYFVCFIIFSIACNFLTLFIRVERATIVPVQKLPLVISAMLFISSASISLSGSVIYLFGNENIQIYFVAIGVALIFACAAFIVFYKKRKVSNVIKGAL